MGIKRLNLTTKILIGLILGIIVGFFFMGAPNIANNYIQPFGTLFLNLIKMIIVPLVLSSLVVGAASVGDVAKLGRIGVKTIVYFLVTTAFAVVIGLVLGNIMQPGLGLTLPAGTEVKPGEVPSIVTTLLNIVPTNAVDAMVKGNMLQIIVFALFLGIGITLVGEKGKPLFSVFDSLAEVMYKITSIIMEYAPIGVFALMVPVVAVNGPAVLLPLLKVILAVYIGCILHAIIVYSFSVKIFAGMSPMYFFRGIFEAAMVAFTTCSSSGTLPITMRNTEDNLGVPRSITSFVLPLGATINMDGTALYQGVCALFIAQVYGVELTFAQQITVIISATLASIGTAGVPGAGFIMLTMVLQSVGLPLEASALIAGIDRILDMIRTSINIVGDASCSVVVAATEKELRKPSKQAANV